MEIEKKQQTQRHQIRSRSYPTSMLAYSQTLGALEGVSRREYPETKPTYGLRGEERWISQYPGMREADFPCVEMVCGLVQHKKGKGPGQIISKFEGIHEFHQIRCIRRSRAFSRHAQTCICNRDGGPSSSQIGMGCDAKKRIPGQFPRARMFSLVRWRPDSAKVRELLILSAF